MSVYITHNKKRKSNLIDLLSRLNVTFTLIFINIILFLIFSFLLGLNYISIDSIAIKPFNILQGDYLWTFFTSMFMHGGFGHLFVNMFSLFFVGSLLEKIIGTKRFFYFYILSGLFAGLFFVLASFFIFTGDMSSYAVGASGALFGLVGILVLLTPNLPVFVFFIPIPIKIKYAAPGLLFLLWVVSVLANIPIGNTAHFGGLLVGLVYGFYLKKKFPKKTDAIRKYFS